MPRSSLCLIAVLFSLHHLCTPGPCARENSTELYQAAQKIALTGDMDGAIRAFREVVKVNPYYALGHYGLGKAYLYKEGKTREAVIHLRLAVEYDRRLSKGHFYLGLAYMFARRYEQAIHAFNTAYESDSGLVEALYNLAVIYDIKGIRFRSDRYYEKYIYEKNRKESEILF